ncbi:BT_3928 family protein [Riemerella columbipharyngis]|uniref:Uncharacterized membrane protein YphA, DoxX/SURF4 family n=1 Tax=Riemerella columbipharyngis TaxID=1071918 RepID=A0A1G7DAT4_9FLAO|nr:BT_3928 family protein [Riemerella columbipharyngis]SDE48629.1 Uncharacterized membrane protein YphA, DoxX/SURF4 family [Riemerella columbipharyngis]
MFKKILRLLVGAVFIVSGFVKAVDAKGFSFKLEEYFSAQVFDLPMLERLALPISIFVVGLELVLGIMLFLGLHIKKVLSMMIALCVYFAFLTFYSAYYNKVTDCGCFGDAIKFTPWESFAKDIVLLVFILILWVLYRKDFRKNENRSSLRISVLVVSVVMSGWVIAQGIRHQPIIDFRDFKVGTDLKAEKQKIAKNPSEYKTFYVLKNTKTKEEKKVSQDDYINKNYWQDSTWMIEEDKTTSELIKDGYHSEVSKFKIEDAGGNDFTDGILDKKNVVLLFVSNPEDNVDVSLIHQVKTKELKKNPNIEFEVVSTAPVKGFENLYMDGTTLKTIARNNMFILVLNKGKIVDKASVEDYIRHQK